MKKSFLYKKVAVLTLLTVYLIIGTQSVSSGQLSGAPEKIKDGSTQYVVWIVTKNGTGSGVLFRKNDRLVVTNAHVTGDNKDVQVYFAVRDSSENIVRARPFYGNTDHQNTLKRLGYVTRGRVIAKYEYKNNEPDLAIIELDGLPETVNPIKLPTSIDYSKLAGEPLGKPVHILGHPDERPLWHWKAGFFKEKKDNDLLIYSDAYLGNSGGPVLNQDGGLIGISRAIFPNEGITLVVPTSEIIELNKTLERVNIFSIYNYTELPINYKIKWNDDEDEKWEEETIEPKEERLYSLLSKDITTGYPKISYDDSQNSEESSESVQKLETKSRFFGKGIKDVGDLKDHIEINDAFRYQFMSDPNTKKLSLKKMKLVQTFMVKNNTKSLIFFQFRWHEDKEWTDGYLRPDMMLKCGELSELVSQGYPRIRFDKIQGEKKYPERNRSSVPLITQTGYFDETTTVKEDLHQTGWNPLQYYQFNINTETKTISLDIMRRTQTFTIQNTTEVTISFTYKWHENGNWVPGHVPPNATGFYAQYSSNVSTDYPKISYTENVTDELQKLSNFVDIGDDNEVERDDDRSTEKVQKLETQTGYSGRNTIVKSTINQTLFL